MPDPNEKAKPDFWVKPKRDFGAKFGQIFNFDFSVRSILRNFKNAITGLFLGSSCLVVPIFVQRGLVRSERQAKM
jgi:hypothetical protein